jgi:RNA polymerase sigma-70 factor (ECF subfamily)
VAFFFRHIKERSDSELLDLFAKKSDQEVLSELFRRYTHLVYGTCMKYLKDREQAQDATMDIYEKLQSALRGTEIKNFKSWLYVIAKNHCLMQLRKKQPEKTSLGDMEIPVVVHPNGEDETETNLQKMEKCLDTLKLEQKECVSWFFLEELSYRQIQEKSTYTMKEIKSNIQNGKRNLKICMEKSNE